MEKVVSRLNLAVFSSAPIEVNIVTHLTTLMAFLAGARQASLSSTIFSTRSAPYWVGLSTALMNKLNSPGDHTVPGHTTNHPPVTGQSVIYTPRRSRNLIKLGTYVCMHVCYLYVKFEENTMRFRHQNEASPVATPRICTFC